MSEYSYFRLIIIQNEVFFLKKMNVNFSYFILKNLRHCLIFFCNVMLIEIAIQFNNKRIQWQFYCHNLLKI